MAFYIVWRLTRQDDSCLLVELDTVDFLWAEKKEQIKQKVWRHKKSWKDAGSAVDMTKVTNGRTDPSVTSEFACDLACGDIPQDYCLIRAAGTKLAVVIGTVKTVNERQTQLLLAGRRDLFSISFIFLSLCIHNFSQDHNIWYCWINLPDTISHPSASRTSYPWPL